MNRTNLLTLLKSIWQKPKPDPHKKTRQKIVAFIEALKLAAENPVTEVILKAIIGKQADGILEAIRKWLPLILKGLHLTQNGFNEGIAIRQAANILNKIDLQERAGYYKMIGGELYQAFTGLELTEAIEVIQEEYKNG